MGADGGYAFYDVSMLEWEAARTVIKAYAQREGADADALWTIRKPGDWRGCRWPIPEITDIDGYASFADWVQHAFNRHEMVYHGALDWLRTGVLLVRVSTGTNLSDEAWEAYAIMQALVDAQQAVELIDEETWS